MKNGDESKSTSLEAMKKRAKRLLKDCRSGDGIAVDFIRRYHPAYRDGESLDGLKLQEVQHAIACKNGYKNWSEMQLAIHDRASGAYTAESVLIFTNGGHAAEKIRNTGIQAEVVAWNDVLHEGPVNKTFTLLSQSMERVAHLASLGWVTEASGKNAFRERDQFLLSADAYSRIELWFEHDLYDQLQLIQILAELGRRPELRGKVWLNQFDDYIGSAKPALLENAIEAAVQVEEGIFLEAQMAWDAFRDSSPFALQALLGKSFELPFLQSALNRLCEEYPEVHSGLPRSSRQILEAAASGVCEPVELFRHCQEREEAVYMGDSSFWIVLNRLTLGATPLLVLKNGKPFKMPIKGVLSQSFKKQKLSLSPMGLRVLQGEEPWFSLNPSSFFIGGVQLFGQPSWKFDAAKNEFVT